jgi:hypothetical protein
MSLANVLEKRLELSQSLNQQEIHFRECLIQFLGFGCRDNINHGLGLEFVKLVQRATEARSWRDGFRGSPLLPADLQSQ